MFSIGVRRKSIILDDTGRRMSWEIKSVAKAEWGAKHTCTSCSAKFYDMGRSPITCPACEAPLAVVTTGRTRRARKVEAKVEAPAPVVKEAADEAKSADDEDAALVEGVDDLVDDDDDEGDAIATLADDDEDDDDVLAEADINKGGISDGT